MSAIRPERPGDEAGIADVVERAFGRPEEARLVERLRAEGDATISLVAEEEGAIVAHVLLSPMEAPLRALGLAPVSVAPERQRRGIGDALVRKAIDVARSEGWEAVFVLGEPAYYRRFGFRAELAAGFGSPYAGPFLMALALRGPLPATEGRIDYAPAFSALS
jgi:putative acetyltransferase